MHPNPISREKVMCTNSRMKMCLPLILCLLMSCVFGDHASQEYGHEKSVCFGDKMENEACVKSLSLFDALDSDGDNDTVKSACMKQAQETGYVPEHCKSLDIVVCNGTAPPCPYGDPCGDCGSEKLNQSRGVLMMNGSDQLNNALKRTIDFALSQIPEIGSLLSFIFDIFFGFLSPGPKPINIWDLIKQQVQLLINQSITELEAQTLSDYLTGWNLRLKECNVTTVGNELCNCLLDVEHDMTGKIPFFFNNNSVSGLEIWLPYAVTFSSLYLSVTKSLQAKGVNCSKDVNIDKMISDNACKCADFVYTNSVNVVKWRVGLLDQFATSYDCNMLVQKIYAMDNYTSSYETIVWCYCTDVGAGCEFECSIENAKANNITFQYVDCVTNSYADYWIKHATEFADEWKKILCKP